MPDNNEEMTLKAMAAQLREMDVQEALAEMARVRAAHDFITEGLAFLREKSGAKFEFDELLPHATEHLFMLDTNLAIENTASPAARKLRVAINDRSDIFTNAAAAPAHAPDYEPAPEEEAKAGLFAYEEAAKIEDADQAYLREAFNDCLQFVKIERDYIKDINPVTAPTDEIAVLTDIARRAVLQGHISGLPARGDNVTPAQEAVFDGISQGLAQRAAEIKLAEKLAAPFLDGLEYLERQSGGLIDVSHEISAVSSEIIIHVSGLALDEQEEPFSVFIKTDAGGKTRLGRYETIYGAHQYDALEETQVKVILEEIAKSAVLAGKIPPAPGQRGGAAGPLQTAVLEGLRQVEDQREMAHIAAANVIEEMEELKRGNIVLSLPSSGQARVDGNGMLEIGADRYNANDPAEVKAALMRRTNRSMLQGQDPPKGKGPSAVS